MQILVNTDNHIVGSAELTRQIESIVQEALSRFGDRMTRVEVHLSDENSRAKSRDDDKRCVMEARLAGLQPITVSADGMSLTQACESAADKLVKTLTRTVERLDDPKGRTSFAGDPSN